MLCLFAAAAVRAADGIVVKSGEAVGFMGDSITEQGNSPSGYVGLVTYALKVEGVEIKAIPAGVSGHTSGNMVARTKPQVLDANANWMTLSCGVNDVMMQAKGKGVDLETFKSNITKMVSACEAKNVRVIFMTPTPLGEEPGNENNKKLADYVAFMKSYAAEKKLLVADCNAAFHAYLKKPIGPDETAGKRLLADGVHPNQTGQTLMAKTVLLAMGVPEADMPKIEAAWLNNPRGKAVKIGQRERVLISVKQFNALEATGGKKRANAAAIVQELWKKALADNNNDAAAAQGKIGAMVDAYIASGGK